jgi:S1-C subfamily serine protease
MRRLRTGTIGLSILLLAALPELSAQGPEDTINKMRRSLVRIQTVSQEPDYSSPWNPGRISRGTGAGFVIAGNRIITNAHVISNARLITVTREGDPKPYPARVVAVGHDCDLAVLVPQNLEFFDGMVALEFGGLPPIESTVMAYGYPIGGDRLSVTRGIVSRIDFQTYSHSGADMHLTIQIDAAINPGNSGGPVMQDGKVVGVAFQGYSGDVAQSTGYMIPTPVVRRFLADIEDGTYDRYMDLSLTYYPLFSPAARRAKGLPSDDIGVIIGTVFGGGSSSGIVQSGDVITAIDGNPVASDGSVNLDGERVEMAEIVERKFKGESVLLDVVRDGETKSLVVPLMEPFPYSKYANAYDVAPKYLVFGGLVFQPMDQNFLNANTVDNQRTRFIFDNFLSDQLYKEREEIVVLSGILEDPVNSFANSYLHDIIEKVNDAPIRNMQDLANALDTDAERYVLEFLGGSRPFVLERKAVEDARDRILANYGVRKDRNLTE